MSFYENKYSDLDVKIQIAISVWLLDLSAYISRA
jgi:hypothetical protein